MNKYGQCGNKNQGQPMCAEQGKRAPNTMPNSSPNVPLMNMIFHSEFIFKILLIAVTPFFHAIFVNYLRKALRSVSIGAYNQLRSLLHILFCRSLCSPHKGVRPYLQPNGWTVPCVGPPVA